MTLRTSHPLVREMLFLFTVISGMLIAWAASIPLLRALGRLPGHTEFDWTFNSGCGLIALLFFAVLLAANSWARRQLVAVTTQIGIEIVLVALLCTAIVFMSLIFESDYRRRVVGGDPALIGPFGFYSYCALSTTVCFVLAACRKWKQKQPIAGTNMLGLFAFSCLSLALLFIEFGFMILVLLFAAARFRGFISSWPYASDSGLWLVIVVHVISLSLIWWKVNWPRQRR